MQPVADDVAELMKTLAHSGRLMALCALTEEERSVGELAEQLDLTTQAMSQQLAILRNKGLVKTRKSGQTVYYALADEKLRKVMSARYETYCQA